MRALVAFLVSAVPLAAIVAADAAYTRRARADGRDPGDNVLVHWTKAHPVLTWVIVVAVLAAYTALMAALLA